MKTCLVCGKPTPDNRWKSCGEAHSKLLRKECERRWREKDEEHYHLLARKRARKYRSLYPERTREVDSNRRLRIRLAVLTHYGGVPPRCQCCGESTAAFLTIDHIDGGGRSQLSSLGGSQSLMRWLIRNNYPSGFQVLCYNCNCGRAKNNGVCPHKSLESKWAKQLQKTSVVLLASKYQAESNDR
jgi:hypothetical protein